MKHPAQAYRQFSVQGASPLGLVVMLYDGAIAALRRAVTAIEAHDIPAKCQHLKRAMAIIVQLEETLNMELGGEVAKTLKAFYMYSRGQAIKANIENSPEILRALIEKFSTVRDAWYQAEHEPSPSSAPPAGEESPRAPSAPGEAGSWRMSA
jgi:flagellar protein FliS